MLLLLQLAFDNCLMILTLFYIQHIAEQLYFIPLLLSVRYVEEALIPNLHAYFESEAAGFKSGLERESRGARGESDEDQRQLKSNVRTL